MPKFYIIFLLVLISLSSCNTKQESKYVIGVSSCSQDIWREKLNRELRTEAYLNSEVELRFASTDNDDRQQIKQIDSLVASGIDILIVSPNQRVTITPAIERAYDKGIPVIFFDRNANTKKYTAYIGGDNKAIGRSMAAYIANRLDGHGVVAEISGLHGSTPAVDRHDGFVKTMKSYPGINIIDQRWGDWTLESGYKQMKAILSRQRDIDFVFCQNDRMALGAYKAAKEAGLAGKIKFTGVDALAVSGGGIEKIQQGILDASCLYPTNGDKVLDLAIRILYNEKYPKTTLFKSAVVTKANSEIIYNQAMDMEHQSAYLGRLHDQVDQSMERLSTQQMVSFLSIGFIVLLIIVIVGGWRMLINHIRMNDERARLQQQQLDFFTKVSHQLRTPLTLIADPIHRIVQELNGKKEISDDDVKTLNAVDRNAMQLMGLIGNILDFNAEDYDAAGNRLVDDNNVPKDDKARDETEPTENKDANLPLILLVEDNADIRGYEYLILKDNYRVIMASDGKQGQEKARSEVPDLIVSDIMMPVMDGLTMCRNIKGDETTSHIPVILLTAKSREDQKAEGYESGADEYLTKPFSSRVLLSCISNILKGREQLRRNILATIESKDVIAKEPKANKEKVKDNVDKVSAHDREFLDKLQASIKRRMTDSGVSVEDIGADVGFSRVQLYRKTKALTGYSPVELLRKMRLNAAKEMLSTTDKTVSEVAYDTGFSSPSYFAKCYKDEFGVTPSQHE